MKLLKSQMKWTIYLLKGEGKNDTERKEEGEEGRERLVYYNEFAYTIWSLRSFKIFRELENQCISGKQVRT